MPRKSRYSPEQIAAALRQAEAGTPIAEITRKLGIHENTFHLWKKRYGSLGTPEIRELRQLCGEMPSSSGSWRTSRWTKRCCRTCFQKRLW